MRPTWHRLILLCLLANLALIGCKSVPEKIDQLMLAGEFGEARALLEEKGAGAIIDPEISKDKEGAAEALSARRAFMERVESEHGGRARAALDAGNSRGGLRLVDEALDLCPWSSNLQSLRNTARGNCGKLDQILAEHAKLPPQDTEQARAFVRRWRGMLPLANDDLGVRQALRQRSEVVSIYEAGVFLAAGMRGDQDAALKSITALDELDIPPALLKSVKEGASLILGLPTANKADRANTVFSSLEQADDARRLLGTEKVVASFADAFAKLSIEWSRREVAGYVSKFAANDGAFVESMERIRQERELFSESLTPHLARAHILRATKLAPMGQAAAAAHAHQLRAQELGLTDGGEEIRRIANATLSRLAARRYSVTLTSEQGADVKLLDQLFIATAIGMRISSEEDVTWVCVPAETRNVDAVIHLTGASKYVPSMSDLSPVSSRYFSHMQSVVNPRKQAIAAQISGAKIALSFAESNYNSAVSFHNIYRTQYTLNSANYAKNNYINSLNNHNSLVSLYNSTPDTIQQPVYMPYVFRQGTMRCGYQVSGKMIVGETEVPFVQNRVDSHFVRIDTNSADVDSYNRRDQYFPDIDIGDLLLSHLITVTLGIAASLESAPLISKDSFLDDLSPGERACVAYILHPLKNPSIERLGVPHWAARTISVARFKRARQEPPALALQSFDLSGQMVGELQDKLPLLRELTCKIECKNGLNDSSGSGAIISGDGLILTAAHVVQGATLKVILGFGPHAGTYDAEIVFVDDRADVAVLRAKGLTTARWLPVRLKADIPSGSPVVALGYPYVANDLDLDSQTVTAGIISTVKDDGTLIADLTVASGNSGGPIIDSKTGEIVGVVTQVISVGFDRTTNSASSGFWCKGFASNRLGTALGLVPAK